MCVKVVKSLDPNNCCFPAFHRPQTMPSPATRAPAAAAHVRVPSAVSGRIAEKRFAESHFAECISWNVILPMCFCRRVKKSKCLNSKCICRHAFLTKCKSRNVNFPKCNLSKYELVKMPICRSANSSKCQFDEMSFSRNANLPKYRLVEMQICRNANQPKCR